MKRKIAALLAALSVFTGVCMPVSADDIAETGSAQVICIQTVEDTDEPDGSDTAEAADNADEPAEAEDTADSEQDNDTDPCEDQAQPDDITDSDVISDTDTESENADADVNEEDSENNATSYIYEDNIKVEDDICDADYSDLINDEIEFLYPGWCSWDSVSGTLTLKGQLPYTYFKKGEEYGLAVIAGIDALNIRKIIITSGTKATTSCSQMFRGMRNLEAIEGLQNLDTSRVETMTGMFIACDDLKYIDLTGFDTSNVRDMSHMFA